MLNAQVPSSFSPVDDPELLYEQIEQLKERENATILAHYYQDGEIQELADHTGDSLQLARAATQVLTDTITSKCKSNQFFLIKRFSSTSIKGDRLNRSFMS